ncbi:DUF6633 family protein [uncultured Bacteroides sp.]|uniref:DUF6633 family protein n=1 Tax=uncultured Bacteroides sp. TaxID=162156 RepID=UPI002AA8AE6A|nr:DUF6633 family protein [uncultured Bacteroides sp.]
MQIELIKCGASHADLALNDTIPSIGLLSSTYGEETPIEWLKIQLGSLNDFAEVSKKITSDQLNELASLIVSEYCYLNAAEICLFIGRFKIGKYGSFYGAIDPLKITSALVVYNAERLLDITTKERERIQLNRDSEIEGRYHRQNISHLEYVKLRERADNGDKEAIDLLGPYYKNKQQK